MGMGLGDDKPTHRMPVRIRQPSLHPNAEAPAWQRLLAHRDSLPVVQPRAARVLLVDDDRSTRRALGRLLKLEGHEVVEAEDGESALAKLEEGGFDVVLLDIMMPAMDGYEVLCRIRETPDLELLPVIMISGIDDMDSVVRCIELGADDYLLKPARAALLRARVRACVERKLTRDQERAYLKRIEAEQQRADDLLSAIFPGSLVDELKDTHTIRPRRHENVAVMFCDVVDFTPYCEKHRPEAVVQALQEMVHAFEVIAERHGLEKIKTIGDAFMATGNLLHVLENPVLNCVRAGQEMIKVSRRQPAGWAVRVGVHIGPVVAGVVGHRQYLFDVWGDTVNTAARVESQGVAGAVALSSDAWAKVQDQCAATSLGLCDLKGKDPMELFAVESHDHVRRTGTAPK